MVQCQTNPDGRCMLEPPCPPGECYLGAVLQKEHSEVTGAIAEDPGIARELVGAGVEYQRGPYTEGEPWDRTRLGLLNAVLDTLVPGARLLVDSDPQTGDATRVTLGRGTPWPRPRDLAAALRDLADCIDGGR